jgi:glycosyltransferase involved in cell wall biosynthesis
MLNHNLRERGTWHRAWHLARELARRGHAVTLWTAAPHHYYRGARAADPELGDRLVVVETPSWAPLAGADDGWGPLDIAWRAIHSLAVRCDLVYAFAHPPNVQWPAALLHGLRRKPLLYDWCDWYEGGIFPKRAAARRAGHVPPGEKILQSRIERWDVGLERRILRRCDRATVISEFLRDEAVRQGRRREDLLLLPNGANLDGIRPLDRDACRRELELTGLPDGASLLAYVANYHPDQSLLLGALAHAVRRNPSIRLLLAGAPFAPALVAEWNLADRIIDLGRVPADRVDRVLGAADALALPLEDNDSNRARVPYKFTDYLASGRAVVTSPVGDLARWFGADVPDPIGLAAAPTPEAYGAAIARAFDPATDLAALGAAARRLAEREFAWSALADRLESFIADWLGAR